MKSKNKNFIRKNKKVLIIGCGPVGCTVAEILSKNSFLIDIYESRRHIAGNCYDYKDRHGVLVHKYGPHYFRTNNRKIFRYLSNFTDWIPGNYIVNSFVDKNYYEFPINLNTINKFFKKKFNSQEAYKFLKKISIKNKKINFENYLLSKIGKKLYNKFYKNYTIKQWGVRPNLISASVAKRIPIKFNKNKDYIIAKYKFMPKKGFTEMFKKMITHKNIKIKLNKKYNFQEKDLNKYNYIVYTGPIDAFFKFKYGKLGWRSLKFHFSSYKKKYKQHCLQINYPNNYKFTRKVEYKYVTNQKLNYTTVSKEFPTAKGDPYYPRSTNKDKSILSIYKKKINNLSNNRIYFAGRLAEYKYINTDEAVEIGTTVAKKILDQIK
jgi:UDP-galactopyranose mutase